MSEPILIPIEGSRPRQVFDPNGPGGEPIETPTDHRMLWHIHDRMATMAQHDRLRELYTFLGEYLRENCQHHWRDYPTCCEPPKPDCYPPHRQCLWCNNVEDLT